MARSQDLSFQEMWWLGCGTALTPATITPAQSKGDPTGRAEDILLQCGRRGPAVPDPATPAGAARPPTGQDTSGAHIPPPYSLLHHTFQNNITHFYAKQACDELQIFCSTCSPTQLAKLKLARVLPISAAQCGLITKSDAERLCSLLLQEPLSQKPPESGGSPAPPNSPAVSPPRTVDPTSFRVLHRCFGECVGLLHPGSCTGPAARCIECTECQAFLSPQKFVSHSHQQQETRTCHWGFDSQNWPAYIQVCEDYSEDEGDKHREELAAIKKRFQLNKAKRKWAEADTDEIKRSRQEEESEVGGGFRGYEPPPGLPGPSLRHSSEMSNSPFPDQPPTPHNQVFLNNMGFPFPQPEKVGFPPFDPRPFYLQWASNPLANPYLQSMRPPCPPAPYLHSLAQFHNLKALATKTILEQQNLAKTLLQASIHSPPNYEALLKKQKSSELNESGQCGNGGTVAPPTTHAPVLPEEGPAISEFVVSVSAVLETTGVDHASKARVMGVVNRLVDRLHRVEEEKDSATLQLKGDCFAKSDFYYIKCSLCRNGRANVQT